MDEKSCSGCINIRCDEYIKFHIQKSEEALRAAQTASEALIAANLKSLQLEYSKSEDNYPTRQQLNKEMGKLLTKDEAEIKFNSISNYMKALTAGFISLFIALLIKYLI